MAQRGMAAIGEERYFHHGGTKDTKGLGEQNSELCAHRGEIGFYHRGYQPG
jgi:hypothetical protein